jgi:undecaprenyl-diphosphatase
VRREPGGRTSNPGATLALLVASCAVVAAAVALSVAAAADDRFAGELRVTRELQEWGWLGGTLADVVRAATTTQVVLVAGAALAGALFLGGMRAEALALAAALLALSLLQPVVKEVVDRPRPPAELVEVRGSVTSASFPAGHVMSPAVLYGFLSYATWVSPLPFAARLALVAACGALLALTGPVNVHLGVHWPSDVAGGHLWGLAIVLPAVMLARALRPRLRAGAPPGA